MTVIVSQDTTIVPFTTPIQVQVGNALAAPIPIQVDIAEGQTNGANYFANAKVTLTAAPRSRITISNRTIVEAVVEDGEEPEGTSAIIAVSKLRYSYTEASPLVANGYQNVTIGQLQITPDVIGRYVVTVSGFGFSGITNDTSTVFPTANTSSESLTIEAVDDPILTPQPENVNVVNSTATLQCQMNQQNRAITLTVILTRSDGGAGAFTIRPTSQTFTRSSTTRLVTFNVTGLTVGTYTYTFRATDAFPDPDEVFNSDPTTFTFAKSPGATPLSLTTITGTSAVLRGSITTNGSNTSVYFEYSTDKEFDTDAEVYQAAASVPLVADPEIGEEVTATINGLSRNTLYYYRIVAENTAGKTISNGLSFRTNDIPVLDPENIDIDFGKVTLRWSDTGADEYVLQWSTNNFGATLGTLTVNGTTGIITNLTNDTTYSFRVGNSANGPFSNVVTLLISTIIKLFSFTPQNGPFTGGTDITFYGSNLSRVISVVFNTYPEKTPGVIKSQTNGKMVVRTPAISSVLPAAQIKTRIKNGMKQHALSNFYKDKITLTDDRGNSITSLADFEYTLTLQSLTGAATCFPASATVQLENGTTKTMADLALDDVVQTQIYPTIGYSPVYLFTHALASVETDFLTFTLNSGLTLTLTPSHYVYANGSLKAAEDVMVGDAMESTASQNDPVVKIAVERANGLYNPHTFSGDIMVDQVRTSTYTNILPAKLAHSILEPVRFLYKLF
jgi:hypothetical protein